MRKSRPSAACARLPLIQAPPSRFQGLPRLLEHVLAYLRVVGELLEHLVAHVDRVHVLLRLEVVEGELVPDGGGRLVLVLPRVLVVRGGVLVRVRARVRVRV